MALTGFEISVGGVLSIPVVAGLTFVGFKTWGEKSLDASKYKPKKPAPAAAAKKPAPEKSAAPEKKAAADKKSAPDKKPVTEKTTDTEKTTAAEKKAAPDKKAAPAAKTAPDPSATEDTKPAAKADTLAAQSQEA